MENQSILKSILRRKGGETEKTRIFSENFGYSSNRYIILDEDEVPILATSYESFWWILFTTRS